KNKIELSINKAPESNENSFLKDANVEEDKGDVVTWKHLQNELNYLRDLTKEWPKDPTYTVNGKYAIYYKYKEVLKDSNLDSEILNSFYIDDLNYLVSLSSK